MALALEYAAMTASDSNNITVNRHALDLMQYFALDAATLILQFSLSSLLFGVLTVLAISSIILLIRRGSSRNTSTRIPLLSTVILYISTTVYMAGLIWRWASVTRIISEANDRLRWDGYDGGADLLALENATLKQSWMVTIALGVNVILGDAVVWWRAYVIWQRRAVYYTGSVLLLLTLVSGIIGAYRSVATRGPSTTVSSLCEGNSPSDVAAVLTLGTNLIATSLIAVKAFLHHHLWRKYLGAFGTKTRVLKVLALLIESGSVYCVILIVVLVSQFRANSTSPLYAAEYYFVSGCLVPLVAIYPTGIIVLTAVNCSPLDLGLVSPLYHGDEVAPNYEERKWQWQGAESRV